MENSQSQIEALRKELSESQASAKEAKDLLDSTQIELQKAKQFEGEVKEKNLLIGKLRHEAVILKDHLRKALRFLKKGKLGENIDK